MSVANWILGRTNQDACRYCKKAPISEAPLPLCRDCLLHAFKHQSPYGACVPCFNERLARRASHAGNCRHIKEWPGNLWLKMQEEFPEENRRWTKKMMARQTASVFLGDQMDATGDLLALQRRAAKLASEGKQKEADALRAEAETHAKTIERFSKNIPDIVRVIGNEGEA